MKRVKIPSKATFTARGKCVHCHASIVVKWKNGKATKSHRCAR